MITHYNGWARPGRWEPAAPSTGGREAHRGGAEARGGKKALAALHKRTGRTYSEFIEEALLAASKR
jgi:hypothetical protein